MKIIILSKLHNTTHQNTQKNKNTKKNQKQNKHTNTKQQGHRPKDILLKTQ